MSKSWENTYLLSQNQKVLKESWAYRFLYVHITNTFTVLHDEDKLSYRNILAMSLPVQIKRLMTSNETDIVWSARITTKYDTTLALMHGLERLREPEIKQYICALLTHQIIHDYNKTEDLPKRHYDRFKIESAKKQSIQWNASLIQITEATQTFPYIDYSANMLGATHFYFNISDTITNGGSFFIVIQLMWKENPEGKHWYMLEPQAVKEANIYIYKKKEFLESLNNAMNTPVATRSIVEEILTDTDKDYMNKILNDYLV